MRTTFRKIADVAIMALIVINTLELIVFFRIRGAAGLYGSNDRFPVPSGYLSDKGFMAPESAPCVLIRLSSDGCPYCRLDRGLYTHLVQRAQQAGCKTIILAPKVGQIKSNGKGDGPMQLQYVDMKFGEALYPFMTPQTMLLDRGGRIMWDREGAMDKRALENALQALGKVR